MGPDVKQREIEPVIFPERLEFEVLDIVLLE
jgi:hypothetical protein